MSKLSLARGLAAVVSSCLVFTSALAFTDKREPSRFDSKAASPAGAVIGTVALDASSLDPSDPLRQGWDRFAADHGGWKISLDQRSGLPLLATGRGIAWIPGLGNQLVGPEPTLASLEQMTRHFLDQHTFLLGDWRGQLVLDTAASGQVNPRTWQVVFRQVVNGVAVQGARFDFQIVQGNLVAFGAQNWNGVSAGTTPALTREQARAKLDAYLGVVNAAELTEFNAGALELKPLDPRGLAASAWTGQRGAGLTHQLVWRFVVRAVGEQALWVAELDANSGVVVSLIDDTRYDRIKGGVFPLSNDGGGTEGQEQAGFPMPFADYTVNGGAIQYTGDHGILSCSTGSTVRSQLNGPYIRVSDNCGVIDQSALCDDGIDLKQGPGTDCQVPAGASAGNTHSARSSFYHLNLAMAKGRAWLPSNTWLQTQLTDIVNINNTCNAFWDGNVNFYRSGGGCGNTGELQGVFVHEWGHGIDANDGGGYDNPSEAYADIVAVFESRLSCVGRGFYLSQQCGGYGDSCLNCTGIRDQDWDQRAAHTPATPQGFLTNNCGGGGGPCGKEEHCESYVGGETMFDLATRDLPAAGFDTASAWQLAERLWYQTRNGSGGNAYNCALPSSDGCGTNSWFHKFRIADDDDGNLNNGTPHAQQIFNAFKRHGIACGAAADASNQNTSSCPVLAKPDVVAAAGSGSVTVSWGAVPGAAKYRILRNDLGCSFAQVILAEVAAPATSYVDADVANGFTVYYRVQAIGSNSACESAVSLCESTAAQPFAGSVTFEADTYGCSTNIAIKLTDANVGAPTSTVEVWSDSELTPENVVLTEIAPGAGKYRGTIASTSNPAVHGDGFLSLHHSDVLHVKYIDANNGSGGFNVPVQDTATGDCIYPVITNPRDTNTSTTASTIAWTTDEASDSFVTWGPTVPPSNNATAGGLTTNHQVGLAGLQSCTVYYYDVRSTDPAGNVAVANNGGQYYHFETLGDFGQGLQPCHQGRLTATPETLSCTSALSLNLVDLDLNLSSTVVNTVIVRVSSTTESTPEAVVLTETGPNTSTFTGSILLAPGPAITGNGRLESSHGDVLTASYADADDGAGIPRVSFDTSVADCNGAGFNPVQVVDIRDDQASVRWTTSEPTTGRVDWGNSASLGSSAQDNALSTNHQVTIGPLLECGRYFFRVFSTDAYGNQSQIDATGQPFSFNSSIIPGVYRDNFDAATTTWTLEGEWQVTSPQGKGTAPSDPTVSFTGTKVLGHDLTGLGLRAGDYERAVNERAISPKINATGKNRLQVWFRRWLNVGGGGISYIEVKQGVVYQPVWTSDSIQGVTQSGWTLEKVDISNYGDNNANLQVAFRQFGGPSAAGNRAGWNVDRFVIHSLNDPDFVGCGACGGAPTFAGITSAVDNNACANNGVTVSWTQAPGWGTGNNGTYTVFRDTVPNFTPSSTNRIAQGVTGTSYNDTLAPNGTTLYYIVRAENDEACSTGANNGGVTDSNLVTRSVVTTSTQSTPGAVAGLTVARVNGAVVRLTWNAASNAPKYRVLRSLSPQPGTFAILGEPAAQMLDDVGVGADQQTYFYVVKGLSTCNVEGP